MLVEIDLAVATQALRAAGAERRFSWQQPVPEIGAGSELGQHDLEGAPFYFLTDP